MIFSLLRTLATLAWGLWFGGMIALLIFVTRLFETSHDTGVTGAPVLFRTFATYQLIVGSATLVLTAILAFAARSKLAVIGAAFLALSWLGAWPIRSLTYRIDNMRQAGQTQTDEFKTAHHRSSLLYVGSAACLLLGGLALPIVSRKRVE